MDMRAWGYKVKINDDYFRLVDNDQYPLYVRTDEVDERQMRIIENPEDVSNLYGMIYSRSDFSGGEGLTHAHRAHLAPRDQARYWRSQDVTPHPGTRLNPAHVSLSYEWTKENSIGPGSSPVTRRYMTSAHFDGKTWLAVGDAHWYFAGTTSYAQTNPDTGKALVITADASYLYAGTDDAVHRRAAGGSYASWSSKGVDGLWAIKGRLLGTVPDGAVAAKELWEIKEGATSEPILSLVNEQAQILCVADIGDQIVAGTSAGDLLFFAIDNETTNIVLIARVRTGDRAITSILSYYDRMFWAGTHNRGVRIWRGNIVQGGFANAQVIHDHPFSTADPDEVPWPSNFVIHNKKIWWAVRSHESIGAVVYDPDVVGTEEGEWLVSTTFSRNVWAYDPGADLCHQSFRVRLALPDIPDGNLDHMFQLDNQLANYMNGPAAESRGVFVRSEENYAQSGFIVGPLGDFHTADEKFWVASRVEAKIPIGCNLQLDHAHALEGPYHNTISTGGTSSWLEPGASVYKGDLVEGDGFPGYTISNRARYIVGRVRMSRQAGYETLTPRMLSFSFRAFPALADLELQLPILVSDWLTIPGRAPTNLRGYGASLRAKVSALESKEATVELLEHGTSYRGYIKQVTHVGQVTNRHGHPQTVAVVKFIGR